MALIPRRLIEQEDPPLSPKETLPTMYDLPSEYPEEPGLPDEFHDLQPQLLSRTLRLTDYSRENCFTASDLNLYYDVKHPLWHKRPDWFLVVNVSRLYEGTELRRSYVSWQEGQHPYVVVEFLSPGTESEDLGRFYSQVSNISLQKTNSLTGETPIPQESLEKSGGSEEVEEIDPKQLTRPTPPRKFEVYEKYLRVPHYIVYSRYTQQLRHFKLDGGRYLEQLIQPQNPRIWLADLEIGLGIWSGVFEDVPSDWLRWCDRQGNWLLTDTEQERLEKEQERLEKERERLEKAQERLEKAQERLEKEQAQAQLRQAAQNLLAAGMQVSQVAEMLGLSEAQVQAFCQSG